MTLPLAFTLALAAGCKEPATPIPVDNRRPRDPQRRPPLLPRPRSARLPTLTFSPARGSGGGGEGGLSTADLVPMPDGTVWDTAQRRGKGPAGPGRRRAAALRCLPGPWPSRHHHRARRLRLRRPAGRQRHRPRRPGDRRGCRDRATHAPAGRSAGVGRLTRTHLGEGVERRPGGVYDPGTSAGWCGAYRVSGPGPTAAHVDNGTPSGGASSAPTPWYASSRSGTRSTSCPARSATCASSWVARARCGVSNPVRTSWWCARGE
jgi:hypothetical protein